MAVRVIRTMRTLGVSVQLCAWGRQYVRLSWRLALWWIAWEGEMLVSRERPS
jgi:hypothetical protein